MRDSTCSYAVCMFCRGANIVACKDTYLWRETDYTIAIYVGIIFYEASLSQFCELYFLCCVVCSERDRVETMRPCQRQVFGDFSHDVTQAQRALRRNYYYYSYCCCSCEEVRPSTIICEHLLINTKHKVELRLIIISLCSTGISSHTNVLAQFDLAGWNVKRSLNLLQFILRRTWMSVSWYSTVKVRKSGDHESHYYYY